MKLDKKELNLNIRVQKNDLEKKLLDLELRNEAITANEVVEYFYNISKRENAIESKKTSVLEAIYNDPYLLYGIKLDMDMSESLMNMLKLSYVNKVAKNIEDYKNDFISKERYNYINEVLNYCYFEYPKDYKENVKRNTQYIKVLKKEIK